MALYKCECNDEVIEVKNVTIKIVEGLGAVPDVVCSCGKYMKLANPKKGCPSFTSNKYGQL
tara:strand:- start:888 stop:1070 length:183 start_codon:yes stop_codon:yes gene_type:complete